jgi:hypothetical protein
MRYLFLLLIPLLVSYSENYRYPCQDPENWETKQCKKPYCSANGTCPEDLTHYEKNKAGQPVQPAQVPQVPSKGECK